MIEIVVRGIPAPQGSKRHVGGGRMIESSTRVKPWRERIASETQRVMGRNEPFPVPYLVGPVRVRVWFMLKRPNGHYGTGRNSSLLRDSAPAYPASVKRNDLDKLVRAVLDGLTDGGAWKDDGQVVSLTAHKLYAVLGSAPGCKIEITEVTG